MNHPWEEVRKVLMDVVMLDHLRGEARKLGHNYVLFEPNKLLDELGVSVEARRRARGKT